MREIWTLSSPGLAPIVKMEELASLRATLPFPVGLTSGGYAPVHPGHTTCVLDSAEFLRKQIKSAAEDATLIVVVNGDSFLKRKRGGVFMPLPVRCQIVASLKGVDIVVPYESPISQTVIDPLKLIRPDFFFKGGDRVDKTTIPEWDICANMGIEVVTNMGADKQWSSSEFLNKWRNG